MSGLVVTTGSASVTLAGGGGAVTVSVTNTGSSPTRVVLAAFDVGPSDYGRERTFTITADPENEMLERDESNNTLRLAVELVSRPSGAVDVACRAL